MIIHSSLLGTRMIGLAPIDAAALFSYQMGIRNVCRTEMREATNVKVVPVGNLSVLGIDEYPVKSTAGKDGLDDRCTWEAARDQGRRKEEDWPGRGRVKRIPRGAELT